MKISSSNNSQNVNNQPSSQSQNNQNGISLPKSLPGADVLKVFLIG